MNWFQSLRMAFKSIKSNKIRAALTMLGIIIGVSAVIAMISIVQGSTKQVTQSLESIGTNLINVNIIGRGGTRTVSEKELFQFAEQNKTIIQSIAPVVSSSVTVKSGTKNLSTSLEGTNEAYSTVRNTGISQGRFISDLDVQKRQKVALIGTYLVSELYGRSNPIDQKIKINGDIYTVIGVLALKSNSTAGSTDDKIIIPYTTAQRLLKSSTIRTFSVQAKTPETVQQAMTALQMFLYRIFASEDAYRVFNQADMLESISSTTASLTMMLGGIAGISLVVGGIGIMNIMLVTVSERTREIGIRKAIGAKRKHILWQFMIEAITVSCMGGIIGVLLGIGITKLVGTLIKIPSTSTPTTIIMSFSFSVLVGIFFGWYPAAKASKLNPIQALRFE